mgnify:CR=1 FL=1
MQCAGFPSGQLARWVMLGISEKQRMFQTYHAAPDDEAARVFQRRPDHRRLGMRFAEYAYPHSCDGLERLHALAEIVEH